MKVYNILNNFKSLYKRTFYFFIVIIFKVFYIFKGYHVFLISFTKEEYYCRD
jgi:hypothetical protein